MYFAFTLLCPPRRLSAVGIAHADGLGQIVLSDVALLLPPLELQVYRTLLGASFDPSDFGRLETYLSPAAVQYLWELLNSNMVRYSASDAVRK